MILPFRTLLLPKEMAAISDRTNIGYEFKIVDSDVLNAFATPGGLLYSGNYSPLQ